MTEWEEVDVPRGAYISWGNTPGQHVTGKVLGYDEKGGSDFDGNPCPSLEVELTEPAASIDKNGTRTDYDSGAMVVLNCGQASLKRAVRVAALDRGDLVKIVLSNLAPAAKGTVKEFSIKVARNAGGPAQARPAPSFGGGGTNQPVTIPQQQSQPPF